VLEDKQLSSNYSVDHWQQFLYQQHVSRVYDGGASAEREVARSGNKAQSGGYRIGLSARRLFAASAPLTCSAL